MEVALRLVWKEARKKISFKASQFLLDIWIQYQPTISYVGKTTLVLFDVERHVEILVFLW